MLDDFGGCLVPCNYVSMKKQGTRSIAPKLCGTHFEGSKAPRGADWGVQNCAGQRLKANLHRGVLDPTICAPQSFGPEWQSWQSVPRGVLGQCNMCPAFSWRCIYKGQNIHTQKFLKLNFPYLFLGALSTTFISEIYTTNTTIFLEKIIPRTVSVSKCKCTKYFSLQFYLY